LPVKRRNVLQSIWPDEPTFQRLRQGWTVDATTELLRSTWCGLDSLRNTHLNRIIGIRGDDRQKERSITQLLVPEIRYALSSASPFEVEQGIYEFETSFSDQAQPPLYDIGFVLRGNKRIIWPIEAKVLPSDGQVGEYVNEVTQNFLTCRYAPLSHEGGMLGYLIKGAPDRAFRNISTHVPCQLNDHPEFRGRNHKVSTHQRTVPPGKQYPTDFTCHHLIFEAGTP
jgi:hypothetical protein